MKYIYFGAAMLLSWANYACDVCGVSTMNTGQGIVPSSSYHFIGVVSNYQQYRSLQAILMSDGMRYSTEHFGSITIHGRWQAHKRFAVLGYIPLKHNAQNFNSTITHHSGLGDISLVGEWLAVNNQTKGLQWRLRPGIKFPTGSFSQEVYSTSNRDLGTGSIDFQLGSSLILLKDRWGFSSDLTGQLNTENRVGYRYGSGLRTDALGYLRFKPNESTLLPFLGASYQCIFADQIDNIPVSQQFNGGHLVQLEAGAQLFTNQWMFSIRYGQPIYQALSNKDVQARIGLTQLSINYLFNKN